AERQQVLHDRVRRRRRLHLPGEPPLQHLQHARHARPRPGLLLRAPQRHVHRAPHRRLLRFPDVGADEPPVDDLHHAPRPGHLGGDLGQVRPPAVLLGPHAAAAGDQLKQHHPVAVDVGLLRDAGAQEPLGRQVARGAAHRRDHPALVLAGELGEAEVGEDAPEAVVEEDVLRLDVQVQHLGAAVVVQVCERLGHVDGDLVAARPRQAAARAGVGVGVAGGREDPAVEGAVVHVLVDEEARGAEAEAEEAGQVDVLRAGDGGHLRPELLVGASGGAGAVVGDPLDGHGGAVVEDAAEDRARGAPPGHAPEVVRGRRQRVQRELARQPGHLAEVAVLHAQLLAVVQRPARRHAVRPPRRAVEQEEKRQDRRGQDGGRGEVEGPGEAQAEVEGDLGRHEHRAGHRDGEHLGRSARHPA
uniref:Uncharacterized protein n=1 Tax=Triticum urartu TaxID=4572 RepID=A0A8R7UXP3_TRIUA